MLSTLMNVQLLPGEDITTFVRRRCRLANSFSAAQGSWSLRWATDLIAWHAHCMRNHNEVMWTPRLATIMCTAELQRKRATFCIRSTTWSCHAGRTDTRYRAGAVVVRTEQSLVEAHLYLQERGTREALKRPSRTF